MSATRVLCLLLVLATTDVWASRTILLPPITNNTVHGGRVPGAGGACVSADLYNTQPATDSGEGVRLAMHEVKLHLRNVGTTEQEVFVLLQPGTNFGSAHSSPPESPTPNGAGPTQNFSSLAQPNPFVIAPGGSATYTARIWTGFELSQWVFTEDAPGGSRVVDGNASLLGPGGSCNPLIISRNCIALSTSFVLGIRVTQDRGAIVGNVVSVGHRCNGFVDHYLSPPQTMPVNSGRAF